jgi:hypothetical protein
MQNCTYCGDDADTEDHLIPVSRQTTRKRHGKMASVSERVPCCSLCNSLLGAAAAFTVRDRAALLILRYAERPRADAHETLRKLPVLFRVVAGFDLGEVVEEAEERNRRRFAEQLEKEQAEQKAEQAAAAFQRQQIALAEKAAKDRERRIREAAKERNEAKEKARRNREWSTRRKAVNQTTKRAKLETIPDYVADIDRRGAEARAKP